MLSVRAMKLEILKEGDEYMVINKPAGISVHGDGISDRPTVATILAGQFPELRDIGEPFTVYPGGVATRLARSGIVHRLDRDTSGCLLVAKTDEAFKFFKRQFQDRQVRKYYEAFVYGIPYPERGIIETPYGRDARDARLRTARNPRGTIREAVTRYVVMRSFRDKDGVNYSFVGLYPKTGRMHQLRVHMKHIQHPIVSDPLYARGRALGIGFTRVALHAREISFRIRGGSEVTVRAPYSEDFASIVDSFDRT